MSERDCPHGHKLGKCDTCELIEAEQRIAVLEAEVVNRKVAYEAQQRISLLDEQAQDYYNRASEGWFKYREAEERIALLEVKEKEFDWMNSLHFNAEKRCTELEQRIAEQDAELVRLLLRIQGYSGCLVCRPETTD